MGNSLTCVSIPATLDEILPAAKNGGPVKIVHLAEQRFIEMAASQVAELMLEFPGHFVSHLDVDQKWVLENCRKWCSQSLVVSADGTGDESIVEGNTMNRRRLAALAADAEVVGGRVYVVAPMERLNQRLGAQESATIDKLLCFHFLSTQKDTAPVTIDLDSSSPASNSCVRFRIPNLCGTSKVAPASTFPYGSPTEAHLLPSDPPLYPQHQQDGNDASLTVCFNAVPGSHNSTHNRYKAWTPKLDTICE